MRLKSLVLQDLTAEAALHKKHQFLEKVTKMVTQLKLKLKKFI